MDIDEYADEIVKKFIQGLITGENAIKNIMNDLIDDGDINQERIDLIQKVNSTLKDMCENIQKINNHTSYLLEFYTKEELNYFGVCWVWENIKGEDPWVYTKEMVDNLNNYIDTHGKFPSFPVLANVFAIKRGLTYNSEAL